MSNVDTFSMHTDKHHVNYSFILDLIKFTWKTSQNWFSFKLCRGQDKSNPLMKEVGKTLTWSLETGWWWWANVECGGGGPGQRLAWTHFATDPRQWWVVGGGVVGVWLHITS